jgi:hypothetical protein
LASANNRDVIGGEIKETNAFIKKKTGEANERENERKIN